MKPTSVLILDDHIAWLSGILQSLESKTKLKCVPLYTSQDLLSQVKRHTPAVIVLNSSNATHLKDMKLLRSCDEAKHIPLVVVSDKSDEEAMADAYTYGCIDFIVDCGRNCDELASKLSGYGCLGLIDSKIRKLIGIYNRP